MSAIKWFQSGLHPYGLTLDDAGIAEGCVEAPDLIAAIDGLRTPPQIRHLRCTLDDTCDASVLIAAGFQQVGVTRLIDVALPHAGAGVALPAGVTVQWATPDMDVDWPAWFAAHWQSYQATHPVNLAADLGRSSDAMIFGGRDLIEALFVYKDADLIGFSSLRAESEIGWIDTLTADETILNAIVDLTLCRATALGWVTASLEVDDDQPTLWRVADRLNAVRTQTFVSWERPL